MIFHLIAPPNVQTTAAYSLDGFGQATIRFAKLLRLLGHTVFLYASEENEAPCDELITIVSKEDQSKMLEGCRYQYAAADNRYPLWDLANQRTIEAIASRKQPQDFICLIGGTSQKVIADAHPDLITVEYSIGYVGCFASYRVYESHAWRNTVQGLQGQTDGRFFDTVIPLFFDDPCTLASQHEGFALYVGRLTPRKGLGIACRAAEAAGIPLKVIGHGDPSLVTNGAEYLGALSLEQRNEWMARAQCLICPTQYIEPFGSVAVEAQMLGTPVVSTDFGAFVETVEHGVSGFRCNTLGDFVRGIKGCDLIDRRVIMDRAKRLYSIEAVAPQYQAYFERLMLLWTDGWQDGIKA